ncbi:alpha-ketoglutarate-dependent dioxygenase AlkB [Sphingosinicella sp. YJ22]|uniref:alpha-ketoglutarate-dependent dioxygenase AlkB n=1 Tax=Sphingosinicella sp. YJ22 TaxID=1104780 RepID=UPI00140CB0BC|nr:alpha-ketoglutarate-dependent dioxygenase AlkB [Sphingosinicella sp. YJ22]
MKHQANLFGQAAPGLPEGLVYRLAFLSAEEEAGLTERIAALPFAPFQFHGFEGNRRTVSFGMEYRFDGSGLKQAEPFPDWLLPVRDRAAELARVAPDAFVHALIIEYAPGAGIGWHRDRPVFGDVVGVSLGAPAPLRFRLRDGAKWRRFTLSAEPRSAYLLRGPARTEWEHSIAAVNALRYSITLRTLRAT